MQNYRVRIKGRDQEIGAPHHVSGRVHNFVVIVAGAIVALCVVVVALFSSLYPAVERAAMPMDQNGDMTDLGGDGTEPLTNDPIILETAIRLRDLEGGGASVIAQRTRQDDQFILRVFGERLIDPPMGSRYYVWLAWDEKTRAKDRLLIGPMIQLTDGELSGAYISFTIRHEDLLPYKTIVITLRKGDDVAGEKEMLKGAFGG